MQLKNKPWLDSDVRGRYPGIGSGFQADWSCVSDAAIDEESGSYLNLVPGDTKISAKWWPELHDDPARFHEWQNAIVQTVSYSAEWQYTGAGLAAGRSSRDDAAGSSQSSSDVSMWSGSGYLSQPLSRFYSDNNPLNWDFNVQHKIIPWIAHGHRLTANLALWALAMMSLNGDNNIDYSYPALNTWRTAFHQRRGIRHNTSGATRPHATNDTTMQERTPQAAAILAGFDEESDDEGGETDGDEDDGEDWETAYFSRAGSAFGGDLRAPRVAPSASSAGPKDPEEKTVKLTKKHGKYYYKDYKGNTRSSVKKDWAKVDGGYLLRRKKHNYFTANLP
ncbi:hypothetical protein MFIFM68171_11009 [Madurella fahalii]|uniref:Uncharacterized protein n=1 Tax=Madurella fahalii TaxID=1157608 RepID=A0ABQ0GSV8_9PEZI